MDPDPQYENTHFRCSQCDIVVQGLGSFVRHHSNVNHAVPYQCAYCRSGITHHLRSLIRHLKTSHPNGENVFQRANHNENDNMNVDENADEVFNIENNDLMDGAEDVDAGGAELDGGEANEIEEDEVPGLEAIQDLCQAAALCTLNLRQTGAVTTSSIQRFQVQCHQMMQTVTTNSLIRVRAFLTTEGIDTQASRILLQELELGDPFQHVRSLKQQLNYFAKEFGMVKPRTCFIDYRQDYFLNPATAQYEPVQVPMSFEYISIILTLTAAISNPKIWDLIQAETPSVDGIMRSYLDGTRSQSHFLVTQYPKIIRIQLYWDDLEVVNALGSKTSIHKLASFYATIQNLPAIESAQLSSIFLLALAHSEDLKIASGFERILAPYLQELRQLEGPRGVVRTVNGLPYVLRATNTVLVADTLAAHEILGLLGPGARCFCRLCLVTRPEFHLNLNAMGQRRTKAMFVEHVRQVSQRADYATECGVRRECPLHFSREFDAMQDSVLDIFHDLLEGVCQWDVSLALRSFIKYDKLFTLQDFNERLAAFNYGIMDKKNQPTSNFTKDSLKGKKLKQTGCQVWCLTRVFGFLVPEVPADDPHLRVVNILQRIMLIAFSDQARHQDIDNVDALVTEHNTLFQQLYVNEGQDIVEGEDDVGYEGAAEEEVDEPNVVIEGNRRRMTPGNKLHHLKHLAEQMRKFGPLIRYWTARYEGRHKIFSQFGAVCCNYINTPKTMAQMFQMSSLSGLQKATLREDDIEVLGTKVLVEASDHSQMLIAAGITPGSFVEICKSVKIAGDEYRPGLFVLFDAQPTFAIIHRIYSSGKDVYFVVQPWVTEGFVNRYCAYEVNPSAVSAQLVVPHKRLAHHRCFAPWNPWKSRATFIAPRTIIF